MAYKAFLKSLFARKVRITHCTGRRLKAKVDPSTYDAQVFPVLAQIRTAAVTKVMPAEVINPNTLYESLPGIWKPAGFWKHPV